MTSVLDLPDDLLGLCLGVLHKSDLASARLACRRFSRVHPRAPLGGGASLAVQLHPGRALGFELKVLGIHARYLSSLELRIDGNSQSMLWDTLALGLALGCGAPALQRLVLKCCCGTLGPSWILQNAPPRPAPGAAAAPANRVIHVRHLVLHLNPAWNTVMDLSILRVASLLDTIRVSVVEKGPRQPNLLLHGFPSTLTRLSLEAGAFRHEGVDMRAVLAGLANLRHLDVLRFRWGGGGQRGVLAPPSPANPRAPTRAGRPSRRRARCCGA